MKINKVCLLLIILLFPVIVLAEGKNTDVIYNVKAEITFNNQNIVITEKVSAGDKLSEPSHIDIDGYTMNMVSANEKQYYKDETKKYIFELSHFVQFIFSSENPSMSQETHKLKQGLYILYVLL